MRNDVLPRSLLLLVAALVACDASDSASGPNTPPPPPPPPGANPGRAAFERECATCHNSQDGFDLAYFSYMDTTIVRRAVKHVDSATSWQIAAYIRSLQTRKVPRDILVFQPGSTPVGNDVAFATALFGSDAWPATLTTGQLRAKDPLGVRIALALPVWSDEGSNLDWLPDSTLPAGILGYAGNQVSSALASYHATPTLAALAQAVLALRDADRDPANPGAPCLFNAPARVQYNLCFQVRRWTSTLIAQHMLRNGITQSVGGELHELWWDVGDAARKARTASGQPVANALRNQALWLYLGWMFDPSRHETFYLADALGQLGLPRHATFTALRSQVDRPPGSWAEHESVYDDLKDGVRHAPDHWTFAVANFGLRHLLERLNAGDRPRDATEKSHALALLDIAMTEAGKKVSAADLVTLTNLANQVRAKL